MTLPCLFFLNDVGLFGLTQRCVVKSSHVVAKQHAIKTLRTEQRPEMLGCILRDEKIKRQRAAAAFFAGDRLCHLSHLDLLFLTSRRQAVHVMMNRSVQIVCISWNSTGIHIWNRFGSVLWKHRLLSRKLRWAAAAAQMFRPNPPRQVTLRAASRW